MINKRLWVCPKHPTNNGGRCLQCRVSIDFNVMGEKCHCGAKADGYRYVSADSPIEFYCEEHFDQMIGSESVVGSDSEQVRETP